MTTGQIVFAVSVLAVTALMVWAIRAARVRESLPAMTAATQPTHVVLWACGHRETQRCDPDCQHSDEPTPSVMRCGDCAREA